MALYISEIKCNKCGFISSGGLFLKDIFPGLSLPSGRSSRSIPTVDKWCFECGGIRPVEILDAQVWFERLQDVSSQIASYQFETDMLTFELDQVDGIPNFGGLERIPVRSEVFIGWKNDISDAVAALNYLAGRNSPANCLTCGGTQIDDVEMRHPDCGGLFTSECIIRMWLKTDD